MSQAGMWQIAAGLFLGIVLLRPLHLLLHELGHAAAILALTSTVPTVRIGHGPSRNAAPLGRLLIQWGAGGWLQADCGYESGSVGRHARVAIAAAGPAASFAAMAGSVLLGALASAPWVQAALLGSAWVHGRIFATSAWPRGGARPSDGAQIRNLLDRSAG